MKSFKLNPYDVLDVPYGCTDTDVKKSFRKKSLLIHPDKYKHPQGEEAFDLLKKAEGILSDSSKRGEIDAVMSHSRTLILKSLLGAGYSTSIPDDDPRLINLKPSLDVQIKTKAKEILIEDELTKRR
ncbi:DnaJ domain-containing protein [Naematelia encephala]|uniref:DnaJ domain-containing protein n=1 Tax=Naematelia encephala TaxID=71784 RepID=A0A1Y2B193_9TREE|nr:DnaJ domain-containing protein [Naematelia encephala]